METKCSQLIKKILNYANISESEEQIEVYVYGLLSILYTYVPLAILLIISVFCNVVPEIILWSILFISLRTYAGGYHAPHPLLCFLYSISLGISCIMMIKFEIPIFKPIYISITLIALLIFGIYSPITKKELSPKHCFICKCKILFLTVCYMILFYFLTKYQFIFFHALSATLLLCIVEKLPKNTLVNNGKYAK